MSYPTLAKEALEVWQDNASFWDAGVALDGNIYWQKLQEPCLSRLLGPRLAEDGGCNVLEMSTGNGICARWMATKGKDVRITATDGSENMVTGAKARGDAHGQIEYEVLDVTDVNAYAPYLEKAETIGGFDVILSNMALMDIADLEPMAEMIPKLLKKGGMFVAEQLHPVFFTSRYTRDLSIAEVPGEFGYHIRRGKLITEYLDVKPYQSGVFSWQPKAQTFFHRPMHELFSIFFKTGLVMDAMEEPAFKEEDGRKDRIEPNTNFTQLPAILAFRMRKM